MLTKAWIALAALYVFMAWYAFVCGLYWYSFVMLCGVFVSGFGIATSMEKRHGRQARF